MLIPVAVFSTIFVCFLGIAYAFLRTGRNRDDSGRPARTDQQTMFGGLTNPLALALPCTESTKRTISQFLRRAGHYRRTALNEFLALRNMLLLGWTALVICVFAFILEPGDPWLVPTLAIGLVGAVVCYALPRLILESTAKSRLERIEGDLPDALDMITMCMTGGLPLQAAIQRVSDELGTTHADLAFELRIVGRQMEAGSLESALRRFAERVDTPEVQSLAAIIGQTATHGASVAAAFSNFADNVRTTRRQQADERGNKTALKLLFPLVFCLAPPVYIMLLAPAAIELRSFVTRESKPGGVLSAAPDTLRPVFDGNPTTGSTFLDLPDEEAVTANVH